MGEDGAHAHAALVAHVARVCVREGFVRAPPSEPDDAPCPGKSRCRPSSETGYEYGRFHLFCDARDPSPLGPVHDPSALDLGSVLYSGRALGFYGANVLSRSSEARRCVLPPPFLVLPSQPVWHLWLARIAWGLLRLEVSQPDAVFDADSEELFYVYRWSADACTLDMIL